MDEIQEDKKLVPPYVSYKTFLNVLDALKIGRAGAAHHADDVVSLAEQKFGQIGTILARNAGDESSRHSSSNSKFSC